LRPFCQPTPIHAPESDMLRLFVALPIDPDVCEQISRVQNGIDGAKWSPRDNLHLTLRFIGDVDEPRARDIDIALAGIEIAPFELSLKGTGYFGVEAPHAIWLGVEGNPSLLALQKKCERACRQAGLAPDTRAYTPHVTLCYLPRHLALQPVLAYRELHNLLRSKVWLADRFYLYSSATHGAGPSRYKIEAEYPLRW
jgi:RNA 2',3'-cyclic 3'-phosphodiesterase